MKIAPAKKNLGMTWVEISENNLSHNVKAIKKLIGDDCILCPTVKANAYGHGMLECSPLILKSGADWLGVNSLEEAMALRKSGIKTPVYIMGYIKLGELAEAIENDLRFVIYNQENLLKAAEISQKIGKPALTHLKLETGNNRQGINKEDLSEFFEIYRQNPNLVLEGLATHFANIEDTTDHSFARSQINKFKEMTAMIRSAGFNPPYIHCANTAATILFPDTHFSMVRAGIGIYGLWPSNETFISARHENVQLELKPVLTWKTLVAQIKTVNSGEYIGYGCTFRTSGDIKMAVLPVGFFDGFSRRLSNVGHVLIRGRRAPILGRICMNMAMVDVTNIPDAKQEDEVVLIGRQGDECITVEKMAQLMGTISYEVVTTIRETVPRILV